MKTEKTKLLILVGLALFAGVTARAADAPPDPECACKVGYGPTAGKECCGGTEDGEEYKDVWEKTGGAQFTISAEFKNKAGEVLNKIPGVNVTIDTATAEGSIYEKDCCKEKPVTEKGVNAKEGRGTLSASLKNITIWGTPAINKKYSVGTNVEADITFSAGVYFDADFAMSGHFGNREDTCESSKTYSYGGLDGSFGMALRASAEAKGCIKCDLGIFTCNTCINALSIKPAELALTFTAGVSTGDKDNNTGFTGPVLKIGSLVYKAGISVLGLDFSYEYEII